MRGLRQMVRKAKVGRQAEVGKKVGREMAKRTEAGGQRVIEKRDRQRPNLQRDRKLKDRQIPRT